MYDSNLEAQEISDYNGELLELEADSKECQYCQWFAFCHQQCLEKCEENK